jgi:hypothetical protein
MNRIVVLGVAIFFALVGIALVGGESKALAFGHRGCCNGNSCCASSCHGGHHNRCCHSRCHGRCHGGNSCCSNSCCGGEVTKSAVQGPVQAK